MTIGLRVSNVAAALAFYRKLGFTEDMVVPDRKGLPQFCHMRYGSSSLVFDAIDTEMPMPDTQRERDTKRGPLGLGVKIGIDVPDIEPMYQVFVEAGCTITAEPFTAFWTERAFNAIDPFGYQWEFRQPAASAGDFTMDAKAAWNK
ncbi:MAG TPA: VOC family protein [Ktedonobacteraceae bacterium]|nr:VOC family protein [Ktedonobacteraceae bacterium]